MDYQHFVKQLQADNFARVERDDRMFDILPQYVRAKGVEVWEQWDEENAYFIRLRILPFDAKKTVYFSVPRLKLEQALLYS